MAGAGASCRDRHGEEDVHKNDAGEHAGHGSCGCLQRGLLRSSAADAADAAAAAASLKTTSENYLLLR